MPVDAKAIEQQNDNTAQHPLYHSFQLQPLIPAIFTLSMAPHLVDQRNSLNAVCIGCMFASAQRSPGFNGAENGRTH